MLLLHHDHHEWGPRSDSHRRIQVYKTRPVAAEAQGQMASTAGIAPATSTFARWRSNLTGLHGQMASVAGLAPARASLKGWLRELLCIHGRKVFATEDENAESLLSGRR